MKFFFKYSVFNFIIIVALKSHQLKRASFSFRLGKKSFITGFRKETYARDTSPKVRGSYTFFAIFISH